MDNLIQISKINDFIFCPFSLYSHSLYEDFDQSTYHSSYQVTGKIKHENIDNSQYSTSKNILQGTPVFSKKYNLVGKIDIFDKNTKSLVERKYKITTIYSGYVYQLYAQFFCLKEANYTIKHLYLHSLSDNKRYEVQLPDRLLTTDFELLLNKIRNFNPQNGFPVSLNKCKKCIYSTLCNYSIC